MNDNFDAIVIRTGQSRPLLAARFTHESHNDSGQWHRSYGNENWEFAPSGLMNFRHASINDLTIKDKDRFSDGHWIAGLMTTQD